jgi:serine phosphatase RsbU (regulator of sigma subunit)
VRSTAALPFLDAKGDVLGVLGLVARRPVRFDEPTVATIRLLGELCGNALRRMQIARRAGQMAALAARLSSAVTTEEVALALREHGHQPLGARLVTCRLVDWPTRTLRAIAPGGLPDDLAARYAELGVDAPIPLSAAVAGDAPVWVEDRASCAARFPAAVADFEDAGFEAVAGVPLHDSSGQVVGVLGMAWRNPVRFDALIQATVLTIADLAAQTLERARLTDARLRSARQREAVAAAGQAITAGATPRDAAALLAREAADLVGAASAEVALLEDDGATVRIVRPDGDVVVDGVGIGVVGTALREGTPIVVPEPAGCAAGVPLHAHDGVTIGALGVRWPPGRDAGEDDLASLRSLAALGGRTIDRAHLHEQQASDARALEAFAAALAGAVRRPEVATVVADHVPSVLGAAYASVAVLDASGRALEHLALRGLPDDLVERFRFVPLDAVLPAAVAFRTGTTTTATAAEIVADYPALADAVPRTGILSTAYVILRDSTNRLIGLLSVGWRAEIAFDDALLARLETLGDLTGQTLERADLYDSEHQLVAAMQERLLGTVVHPPSVDLATRYLPAVGAVGIGGDWFDVVPGERGFTLVVGDVTGHGVEAVMTMAQLRTLIGGLLRAGDPLESVFARVESMLDRGDLLLASAELFEVDTTSWKLRYCSAGHPWALLRRADGSVEVLDGGQQALLGAPVRVAAIPTLQLEPGDTLVAYTDGLVERRTEPITAGIERLVRRLAATPPGSSAEAIADALLSPGDPAPAVPIASPREDDVALVVLRRP